MTYLTYVHSRPFGPYIIPISVQSTFLKSYCESNLITYSLPVTEYTIPYCYFSLSRLLEDQSFSENEIVLLVTSMYIFQELSYPMSAYQSLSMNNIPICCVLERFTADIDGVMSQLEQTAYYDSLANQSAVL
ncbi:MAG: hypothetical protein CMM03_03570 [Rhodopirellula sp.]|nr:hypothetical protein [Rhodopirellula sp.]